MSLAETSDARKARLLELKKRKETSQGIIKNRNFDPESRTLKKHAGSEDVEMDTVEKKVEGLAEQVIAEDEEKRAEDLNVFNIAPKRPNWDLKRETDKKLAKLERKTQEAIHTLIRQRLAAQKGESDDIVGAMRAQERAQDQEDLSDEE
ncbi:mRNA splicing factor [Lentinula raphanica]|uniref:mRNA splicing factor n=1 Tax=Lentinula raphanica TaxID=153919 RepID=A0AA38UFR6_9AGAR|nr:mRNA splicing factor [Lentinula raphanica]KAJ3836462.1 mRNA splicing factor [Lentinula raphanica]KAJ3969439.1 mRNA splicing factor [Lentinula raphanica]